MFDKVNELFQSIKIEYKFLDLEKELVTMALKGMSPANYVQLDLIVVVADGELRQVLKPRKLPWEN